MSSTLWDRINSRRPVAVDQMETFEGAFVKNYTTFYIVYFYGPDGSFFINLGNIQEIAIILIFLV